MIREIKLKNFKCFKDETIPLKPLSILTGLNGMGKSTVIQALLLLRQNYELGLYDSISLNGELVQLGNSKDLLYQYFQSHEVGISITDDQYGESQWSWDAGENIDHMPLKSWANKSNQIYNSSLFGNHFHYLHAERMGPRVYYETSNYRVIHRNQIGLRGEFTVNYMAEFQNRQIPIKGLKHPDSEGFTLYEQVNAWMGEIRPGTRINVTNAIDMNLVGLTYQFLGGMDAGNKFRPTNVGCGFSFLLPIVVAILSSEPGALIVVENPEAHLHPRGQSQMGRLFALAAAHGIQMVVETHSDHILNGVRVAVKEGLIESLKTNFLYFSGEVIEGQFKHYILTPRIDPNGRIDEWPEGFFDEWEKQLTNLM
jgi:predicted ATPase